jgi:magnesium chelatase family protein
MWPLLAEELPKPGEISMAHNGVLFLDELPEFKRDVLEVMRQPLEDSNIKSEIYGHLSFVIHVSSQYESESEWFFNDPDSPNVISTEMQRYLSKSGPLLDRIDIHIKLHLFLLKIIRRQAESSVDIRKE